VGPSVIWWPYAKSSMAGSPPNFFLPREDSVGGLRSSFFGTSLFPFVRGEVFPSHGPGPGRAGSSLLSPWGAPLELSGPCCGRPMLFFFTPFPPSLPWLAPGFDRSLFEAVAAVAFDLRFRWSRLVRISNFPCQARRVHPPSPSFRQLALFSSSVIPLLRLPTVR